MPRKRYPESYRVEFAGTSESMEWSGEVEARSKTQAIVLAAVKARDEGVLFTDETWTHCEWLEK